LVENTSSVIYALSYVNSPLFSDDGFYGTPQSFTSAVCATAYPSNRPSVTLRYYVKTRERRGMQSSPSVSPVSLVFWCQEWLMGATLSR